MAETFTVEDVTEWDSRPPMFASASYFTAHNEFRALGFQHPDRVYLLSVVSDTRARALDFSDQDNVLRRARGLAPLEMRERS